MTCKISLTIPKGSLTLFLSRLDISWGPLAKPHLGAIEKSGNKSKWHGLVHIGRPPMSDKLKSD